MLTEKQYELAVEEYHARLFGYFMRRISGMIQDAQDVAEDLVARTYFAVWEKRARFNGDRLDRWVWGFARNEFFQFCRIRDRQNAERKAWLRLEEENGRTAGNNSDAADPCSEWRFPEGHLEASIALAEQLERPLMDCIEQLRPRQQRIVGLYFGLRTRQENFNVGECGQLPASPVAVGGEEPSATVQPLTDPEIARRLLPRGELRRTKESIKKARQRAVADLRKCLERFLGRRAPAT